MSDARCEEFRELVSAFVDEHLDGPDLLRLEAHFEACRGCRAFEGELRHFKELLLAAEAFRPLRRPPPGFAAMVAARIVDRSPAQVITFPATETGHRFSRAPWVGMVAAAAAAALFFAWSWQRLLPVASPDRQVATSAHVAGIDVAAADGGSMDIWMREHAMLARSSTLLGSAEEIEFTRFHTGVVPER